jgi:hypothetical protein
LKEVFALLDIHLIIVEDHFVSSFPDSPSHVIATMKN